MNEGNQWLSPKGENLLRWADTQPAVHRLRKVPNMKNENDRAREARAQKGAASFLRLVEWQSQGSSALLPPALRAGLYVADADLVVLPSAGNYPFKLDAAVRETRVSALIIEPGSSSIGTPTYYFTLVRRVAGEIRWSRALRFWVGPELKPYLVPDTFSTNPDGECFALEARGVSVVPAPWSGPFEHDLGIGTADSLLLAL